MFHNTSVETVLSSMNAISTDSLRPLLVATSIELLWYPRVFEVFVATFALVKEVWESVIFGAGGSITCDKRQCSNLLTSLSQDFFTFLITLDWKLHADQTHK